MNYPRRQQYRRVRRAAAAGAAGVLAAGLALLAASLGAVPVAAVLLLVAVALGGYARHWARLASRSRVGARSEDQVQRALAPLQAEGWFEAQHVALVIEMAAWLRRRRRRWCPHSALPVLCAVHATRLERVEAGVLIVSLDRLVAALRTAAGTRKRPAFLSPIP